MISKELHKDCVKWWFEWYEAEFEEVPEFDGKDGTNLKQLLNKIKRKHKQKDLSLDDSALFNSFSAFISTVKRQATPWLRDHFEIAIINSHFNSLYVRAKKAGASSSQEKLYNKWTDQDSASS